MKIKTPLGATPLEDEILRQLIPNLTTQDELNEFEAENIIEAELWAKTSRSLRKNLISATGLVSLHKKMFGKTWDWAGKLRWRQTSIGVAPEEIQNALGVLLGDVEYWLENKTYNLEEIAIRFHHKLVWIHPFPNGNGRFARLAANLMLEYSGQPRFSWGQTNLSKTSEVRKHYINALKKADKFEKFNEILLFAKS